jgi:Protein of unknown function (DUF3089)
MRVAGRLVLAAVISAGLALAPGASAKTVWLCKPGLKDNACEVSLKTTRLSPAGDVLGTDNVRRVRKPRFDCFYVYPTVSDQQAPQATKRIDPEERSVALYQTSRYSRDCRVYAPMYRQITLSGLTNPSTVTPEMRESGYADVREAWRTYLRKFNRGRGVVLIGHSQGTFVLRRLVAEEIDRKKALRDRLISALLLGGNVTVAKGKDVGGDFKKVGACRSKRQTGCVVAFSTFNATPPANALFGRSANAKREVLCTNPAALGGGSANLDSVYPSEPFAPGSTIGAITLAVGVPTPQVPGAWREYRGAYRARCSSAGGANALEISPLGGAPTLNPIPDATWGLHLVDANIALGNLADLVRTQAAAWAKQHRS